VKRSLTKCNSSETLIILGGPACDASFYNYPYQWTGGANGNFFINFPTTVSAWTVNVQFASPVNSMSVWNGASISCSGAVCTFSNAAYNGPQNAGTSLTLGFQVYFSIKINKFRFR